MTKKNVALVVGALGLVGRSLVRYLEQLDNWDIIGLSRRRPDFSTKGRYISVDLGFRLDCMNKLSECSQATHIFYTAYSPRAELAEETELNTRMFVNFASLALETVTDLKHFQIMQGSKWYGNHLGPYKTPAKEDDPGHLPPNFYFNQQEWLTRQQQGQSWTWSALRPHGICGFTTGSSMNQLTAVALYAAICKYLGRPLRFPGKPGAFDCIYQFTEAAYLARGMIWAATNPACANQALNFTNGDFIRWRYLWPKIAHFFEMESAEVQTLSLAQFMADKEPLWQEIRQRYQLRNHSLAQLTNWTFADFVLGCEYDQMSDMTKARNAGWIGANDSEKMYLRLLQDLRKNHIIP